MVFSFVSRDNKALSSLTSFQKSLTVFLTVQDVLETVDGVGETDLHLVIMGGGGGGGMHPLCTAVMEGKRMSVSSSAVKSLKSKSVTKSPFLLLLTTLLCRLLGRQFILDSSFAPETSN
jgi:hypothetical protein